MRPTDKPRVAYCTSSGCSGGVWCSCWSSPVGPAADFRPVRRVAGVGRVVEELSFVVVSVPVTIAGQGVVCLTVRCLPPIRAERDTEPGLISAPAAPRPAGSGRPGRSRPRRLPARRSCRGGVRTPGRWRPFTLPTAGNRPARAASSLSRVTALPSRRSPAWRRVQRASERQGSGSTCRRRSCARQ